MIMTVYEVILLTAVEQFLLHSYDCVNMCIHVLYVIVSCVFSLQYLGTRPHGKCGSASL